jgi:flagellar motor protein MotB
VNSMAQGFDGVQWIKRKLSGKDRIGPEPGIISPQVTKVMPKPHKPAMQKAAGKMQKEKYNTPTQNDRLASMLRAQLGHEIATGKIFLERQGDKVIIRFPESVSFTSGSDTLAQDFIPVIHRISDILSHSNGKIVVAGHTDDHPISTLRFRSNWELSAARAVSVVHYLLETNKIDPKRVVVSGYADTKPLEPNTSEENRMKNRRVEIRVSEGKAEQ